MAADVQEVVGLRIPVPANVLDEGQELKTYRSLWDAAAAQVECKRNFSQLARLEVVTIPPFVKTQQEKVFCFSEEFLQDVERFGFLMPFKIEGHLDAEDDSERRHYFSLTSRALESYSEDFEEHLSKFVRTAFQQNRKAGAAALNDLMKSSVSRSNEFFSRNFQMCLLISYDMHVRKTGDNVSRTWVELIHKMGWVPEESKWSVNA